MIFFIKEYTFSVVWAMDEKPLSFYVKVGELINKSRWVILCNSATFYEYEKPIL